MSNRTVLATWIRRWNHNLLRFLGSRVHSAMEVEELAQETYLRLLRLPDLGTVRNPEAYLIRVASHIVTEWRQRPRGEVLAAAEAEGALVDSRLPELEIDASLSQEKLDRTLADLSPMMRAVVLLRLRENLPYKDIAQHLGITERMVKRHLARGYERLRQAFEEN